MCQEHLNIAGNLRTNPMTVNSEMLFSQRRLLQGCIRSLFIGLRRQAIVLFRLLTAYGEAAVLFPRPGRLKGICCTSDQTEKSGVQGLLNKLQKARLEASHVSLDPHIPDPKKVIGPRNMSAIACKACFLQPPESGRNVVNSGIRDTGTIRRFAFVSFPRPLHSGSIEKNAEITNCPQMPDSPCRPVFRLFPMTNTACRNAKKSIAMKSRSPALASFARFSFPGPCCCIRRHESAALAIHNCYCMASGVRFQGDGTVVVCSSILYYTVCYCCTFYYAVLSR